MVRIMGFTAAAVLLASPALAQDGAIRTAHAAIASGDFIRAEQVLTAEQRVFPDSPEVLINLAAVYARTGRVAQAAALYRHVLSRADVLMDQSGDRTASSHLIARTGLQRVSTLQTAAR
ncbi:MAG: tetratricopeptide repeat protein [Pseudomonadota bacterium]